MRHESRAMPIETPGPGPHANMHPAAWLARPHTCKCKTYTQIITRSWYQPRRVGKQKQNKTRNNTRTATGCNRDVWPTYKTCSIYIWHPRFVIKSPISYSHNRTRQPLPHLYTQGQGPEVSFSPLVTFGLLREELVASEGLTFWFTGLETIRHVIIKRQWKSRAHDADMGSLVFNVSQDGI